MGRDNTVRIIKLIVPQVGVDNDTKIVHPIGATVAVLEYDEDNWAMLFSEDCIPKQDAIVLGTIVPVDETELSIEDFKTNILV